MRKHRSLIAALVFVGLVLGVGNCVLHGRDQRASLYILSEGTFSAPELRMQGRPVARLDAGRGPFQHYAWANLQPHLDFTRVEVSWTGADGRRRTVRGVMRHEYEPHCAYVLRLDAAGDPIPAVPGMPADGLHYYCHE